MGAAPNKVCGSLTLTQHPPLNLLSPLLERQRESKERNRETDKGREQGEREKRPFDHCVFLAMGFLTFFACSLLAFGPALALFLVFLLNRAPLIVLCLGSSLFWIVSIILSSIIWYEALPFRTSFAFVIPFSVLVQEAMRWAFYQLFCLTKTTLSKSVSAHSSGVTVEKALDPFGSSIAIGLGFGLTHAVVMYGSILVESTGPGTLLAPGCKDISIFVLSAFFSSAFIMMHVLLSLISFDVFRKGNTRRSCAIGSSIIVGAHLAMSFLTLLNQEGGSCLSSMLLVSCVLIILGIHAVTVVFTERGPRADNNS